MATRENVGSTPSPTDDAPAEDFVRADEPIEHRSQDKLKRVGLAEAIAEQVIKGPPGHGLVIGVAGKWGSGKTSVLKMVEEAVHEKSDTVIVRFNPWLFANAEQLVSRFMEEVGAQLRDEGKKNETARRLVRARSRTGPGATLGRPRGRLDRPPPGSRAKATSGNQARRHRRGPRPWRTAPDSGAPRSRDLSHTSVTPAVSRLRHRRRSHVNRREPSVRAADER